MKVSGKPYRTVWMKKSSVFMIDQTLLPFHFKVFESKSCRRTCLAIKDMTVRGAGAIGATAGYAMAQAFLENNQKLKKDIEATRPTAQNLFYATNRVFSAAIKSDKPAQTALEEAEKIAAEDVENCRKIGEHGLKLIENIHKKKGSVNIETHCNAGWLAFVDWGTALSPIYLAHRKGLKVFVYADETGPRGQGAKLTAWELKNENVPYNVLPDTAGADLMRDGKIDMMIVGADRIAANGDTANKIGTFQKAIVAKHFGVPFYIAAPTSTFDLKCKSGKQIPIEHRHEDEVLYQTGSTKKGNMESVLVCSPGSSVYNPSFDVTPADLLTGIITEKGIIKPTKQAIKNLFQQ